MTSFKAFLLARIDNIMTGFPYARKWNKKASLVIFLGIFLSIGLFSLAYSERLPFPSSLRIVPLLIYLNLAFIVILLIILLIRFGQVWVAQRRGFFGSHLRGRMMLVFGGLALFPTLIITISSTLFFDLGLNSWFSNRVKVALSASLQVSEAYVEEHARNIRIDAFRLAEAINQRSTYVLGNQVRLQNVLRLQAGIHGLSEAVIFDINRNVLARAGLTILLETEPVPLNMIEAANRGEIFTVSRRDDERLRALIRLKSVPGSYLYVGRLIDFDVISHYFNARNAVSDFNALEAKRNEFQISFALFFILLSLLLLTISLWIGFAVASRFTKPIGELLSATNKMSRGDFSARVTVHATDSEFEALGQSFNRMASQISDQHNKLLEAYSDIDERRRFNEGVLTGVSAGVIGLDSNYRITIFNPSAETLLKKNLQKFIGKKLEQLIPEAKEIFVKTNENQTTQLKLVVGGEFRHFLIRTVDENVKTKKRNHVLTFDDVTRLLTVQSKAAWSDAARRIAHEIKNPLTPIQLAAERLKHKFSHQLSSKKETAIFEELADTIIRQVESLERMVDSFSRFARMPKPVMDFCDVNALCYEALLLQSTAWPMIHFKKTIPSKTLWSYCDYQLITQVLTNLISNAVDSIEQSDIEKGEVELLLKASEENVIIEVSDNGKGFDDETNIDRLGMPYYTTRPGGTGLGLAIVIKVMEEHQGSFALCPNPHLKGARGALSRIVFPQANNKPKTYQTGTKNKALVKESTK